MVFGYIFIAVPLRKEVIIREKLKFPSGTATALMIGVLHGNTDDTGAKYENPLETFRRRSEDILRPLSIPDGYDGQDATNEQSFRAAEGQGKDHRDDWKAKIRLLVIAFGVSAIYVWPVVSEAEGEALMCIDPCVVLHSSIAPSPDSGIFTVK